MFAFVTSSTATRQTTRGRVATAALWILQLGVAAMFLFAGSLKLGSAPEMVATFDLLGLGQWFRYATGGIEVIAATLLLLPRVAVLGALLLVPTMIGAIVTHLVIGGAMTPAVVLLVVTAAIAWFRRDDLTRRRVVW